MKHALLATAFAFVLGSASMAAMADNGGTINVSGKIEDKTCEFSSPTLTWNLSQDALPQAHQTADYQDVIINVSDCPNPFSDDPSVGGHIILTFYSPNADLQNQGVPLVDDKSHNPTELEIQLDSWDNQYPQKSIIGLSKDGTTYPEEDYYHYVWFGGLHGKQSATLRIQAALYNTGVGSLPTSGSLSATIEFLAYYH